ncbi:hypothetical protein F5J12DRAFT_896514 [Pisolithus orientalis]|uniref:uncharacterized protein n=1 Tax=Pisolithus orientalis TaxID=936130 RepID=UPI0022254D09|nr:uncharacterized protein F5J12DRAFT_896514 [Pisolithus orientalis]KAI5995290.1 hypothetical protein F5J12DRAFT_896514 [Pisolithus orientalis]
MAEADKADEGWVAKEIACGRANEDMQMEEEVVQAVSEQGVSVAVLVATEKMSHVEVVAWPVQKQLWQTVAESMDKDKLKIIVPPSLILHKMKQGCEKLTKAMGKKAQAGTLVTQSLKAVKAGLSKRATDDDTLCLTDYISTANVGESPTQSGDSPGHAGDSPTHPGDSPRNAGDSPDNVGDSPGNAGDSPTYSGDSPGHTGDSPTHSGESPGNVGESPTHSGDSPGNAGDSPTHSGDSPRDT